MEEDAGMDEEIESEHEGESVSGIGGLIDGIVAWYCGGHGSSSEMGSKSDPPQ